MPYKLAKKNGKVCVVKKSDGKNMGCHGSDKEATAQLRALYAAESGRKETDESISLLVKQAWDNITTEDDEDEPETQKEKGYVPYGATSYEELDAMRDAQKRAREVTEIVGEFPMLAMNIMDHYEIEDKAGALRNLGKEMASRIEEGLKSKAVASHGDVSPADEQQVTAKYGDVIYADPTSKKYPIDTEAHIRAAWNHINKGKDAGEYSASDATAIKRRIIAAWKKNIDKAGPPSVEKGIGNWYIETKDAMRDFFIEVGILKEKEEEIPLMIWKEKDGIGWRWLARYSNHFRDVDNIPEIIASESHRNFVDMVDKGIADMPELWLWHVPEWKIGQADVVAYDDTGFAIAAGHFDNGLEDVAEWLSKQVDWKVSHGMPPSSVRRDQLDPTIIIEHVTQEISPLPGWAAANKLTGFVTINKEAEMGIPAKKKEELLTRLQMPADLLAKVEAHNVSDATKATNAGVESKEKGDEPATQVDPNAVVATTDATPPTDETKTPDASKETAPADAETPQYVTAKEVAEAITTVYNPVLNAMVERIESLENVIKEMSATRQQEVKETIANTPAASLLHLMQTTAIGTKENQVEKGDPLTKGPKQTEPIQAMPTAIPFINTLLSQEN